MRQTTFNQRIGSVLRDNLYDRHVGGKRSGKLNTRALYKANFSEKLFQQKEERKNKEYSIVILVDLSGSMRVGKMRIETAANCIVSLISGLEANNLHFAVVGYNRYVFVFKRFEQSLKADDLLRLFVRLLFECAGGGAYGGSGCTHDYFGIHQAIELLKNRKGKKIVLTFTDGSPACGCSVCSELDMMGDIEGCRKLMGTQKDISFIGFGIHAHIGREYPESEYIENLGMFQEKVLARLSRHIQRG